MAGAIDREIADPIALDAERQERSLGEARAALGLEAPEHDPAQSPGCLTMPVDLIADVGESFGALTAGDDEELLDVLTAANVACGFHSGDPRTMQRTVAACRARGVAIGAHPGFPDLVGFGRRAIEMTREEVRTDVLYQLGALSAFVRAAGDTLRHLSPHGRLGNLTATDATYAAGRGATGRRPARAPARPAADRRLPGPRRRHLHERGPPGQARPGDTIRFRTVDARGAVEAARRRRGDLLRLTRVAQVALRAAGVVAATTTWPASPTPDHH
jgi:hypothetical protein